MSSLRGAGLRMRGKAFSLEDFPIAVFDPYISLSLILRSFTHDALPPRDSGPFGPVDAGIPLPWHVQLLEESPESPHGSREAMASQTWATTPEDHDYDYGLAYDFTHSPQQAAGEGPGDHCGGGHGGGGNGGYPSEYPTMTVSDW